jgi:hypothetical protein
MSDPVRSRRPMRFNGIVAALASAFLIGGGAYGAVLEWRSLTELAGSNADTMKSVIAHPHVSRFTSLYSAYRIAARCGTMPYYPAGSSITGDIVAAVRSACEGRLSDLVKAVPAQASAWTALARIAELKGNQNLFEAALIKSASVSSSQAPVAIERFYALRDRSKPRASQIEKLRSEDMKLMMRSQKGRIILARHYIDNPSARLELTSLVESLGPDQQRRFLSDVQSIISRR